MFLQPHYKTNSGNIAGTPLHLGQIRIKLFLRYRGSPLTQKMLDPTSAGSKFFFLHGLASLAGSMCNISHILLEHNGIGRIGVNMFFI